MRPQLILFFFFPHKVVAAKQNKAVLLCHLEMARFTKQVVPKVKKRAETLQELFLSFEALKHDIYALVATFCCIKFCFGLLLFGDKKLKSFPR